MGLEILKMVKDIVAMGGIGVQLREKQMEKQLGFNLSEMDKMGCKQLMI